MLKAIKLRIYPNREQADFIARQLGCCRFVYNRCLAYRKESYEKDGTSIGAYRCPEVGVRVAEGGPLQGPAAVRKGYEQGI